MAAAKKASKMAPKKAPATLDAYIAAFPAEVGARLQALRKAIHKAVPGLEEDIRYQIPTFRWRDRNLVHIAAYPGHIGFYPVLRRDPDLEARLRPYLSGAATARFPHDNPLPMKLVGDLVKRRRDQLAEGAQSKKGRKPASKAKSARPKATSKRSSSKA